MKRSLSIFLCIAMLLGMTPVQAYASAGESAANAPKEEWTQTSVKVAPDPGLPENDELYNGYVQQLFYGKDVAVFGTAAGKRLSGDEKLLYDALVPLIRQLASGQRASSFLCIGQEVTDDKGTVYPVDAEVVFAEPMISDASLGRVVDALLADLPYEMYWYDKVDGCEAAIIHGSTMLQICLRFTVADNYYGSDDYSVDTTKARTATTAAANAQKLIDTYASASDYEKLVSYKDEICALVSYDHAAADDGHFSTDNDPWQLIYVFDGDNSTNVVCEGYSKAFMYLCDMTAFAGDVSCYTVMGTMDDGNHMWNVVSISGGNYLADVTNSDVGNVGQDGSFFLTGASGSAAEGYVVDGHTYRYDEDTRNLWGTDAESILTLKNTPYDPSAESTEIASGTCGENLTWTLGSDGVLVISGTGEMKGYYGYGETAPWYSKRSEITEVIVESGVTSIGRWAFYNCSTLTSIELPDTITSIGNTAFENCSSLRSIEIPDGVTDIGNGMFSGCGSLTSIVIPDSVTSIGERAFENCSILTSIKIPDGVTSIGSNAFANCSNLKEIFFTGNAPTIAENSFSGVNAIAYYPPDDTTWTSDKRVGYGGSITWVPFRVKLDAPEVNASNDSSTGKIKLTWEAVDGATQYKVYRATSKTGKYKLMKTTTGTSYTNTSSQVGEKFYYYVVAETPYGLKSAPSSIVNRTCGLPRPVVTASNVASSGKIKLTWDAIDGAVAYEVYRATSKTGPYSITKTTTGTSYINTSAEAGNPYYYKVIAVHADSAANSAYSEVKSRTCDLPRPAVTASNVASSGKIKLTWEAIDGAVEYKVLRATSKTGPYSIVKTTAGTSYTNTSAETGNAYYYKVIAVHANSAANSAYSEVKSRTCDLPRPVVTASNVASSGKIKLTWNDVASAVEYKVYRATSKSGEYKLMKTTTSTSYTNTSAEAGNTYYYKVVAVHSNSAANSAYSEVKSRTCDLARPVVSVTLSSSGKPVVSWNVVSGAEKYKVYMYDANGNLLKTSTTSKTKLTYTSAVKGDTYTYQVVAVHSNTNANSAKSTGVSIKCK